MLVLLYSGETWAVVNPFGLRRICGISLRHVPNVVIIKRCNTLSVESPVQKQRLRWLGHVFQMPKDRLPNRLFISKVKVLYPSGRPRSNWNDIALCD